jgi:hypothetical protein
MTQDVVARFAQERGNHVCSSRESAQFPTGVKEVVTLLVKSKTREKAVLHRTFEGQRDRIHSAGDPHSHGVGD